MGLGHSPAGRQCLYGLPIGNVEVGDAVFSDHLPVFFEICITCDPKVTAPTRRRRTINSSTVQSFSDAFNAIDDDYSRSSYGLNNDDLTSFFSSTCLNILDTVAPFKMVRVKPRTQPWLNATT